MLTYRSAYELGNRVKIGDVMGNIIEKNLLVTRIRTIKNEKITIPNSSIVSSYITVTISHDVPWQQVNNWLITDTLHVEGARPEPFALQTSLNDNYLSYRLNSCNRALYPRIYQFRISSTRPG